MEQRRRDGQRSHNEGAIHDWWLVALELGGEHSLKLGGDGALQIKGKSSKRFLYFAVGSKVVGVEESAECARASTGACATVCCSVLPCMHAIYEEEG
jgi:hypothetical protein